MHHFVAILGLLSLSASALSQPRPATVVVRDESPQTAKRLTEAAEKAAAGKFAEAVADLHRILDAAGDDLVPASKEHLVPARRFAHRQLAALPADPLTLYRDRIDEPARVLLAKGKADRDPQPLRQLLARYFVSRSTPEALIVLGDLAFERGEFRRAETYWRQLLPPESPDDWTYPDPPKDPAVRARVVLAQIYQRNLAAAKASLAALQTDFPAASGRLAGVTGPYVATLQALLDHPPESVTDPASRTWSTLGGDASRAGFAPGAPFRIPVVPTWVTPIPRAFGPFVSPASLARTPPFHPAIAHGKAYIADAARVLQFDLKTGTAAVAYDLRRSDDLTESRAVRSDELQLPPKFDADYALTVDGGRVYARLGTPFIRRTVGGGDAGEANPASLASVLVRLDPPTNPDPDVPLERTWSAKPPKDGALWEGAPLVAAGRVFAAFTRAEGDRVIYSVACYSESAATLLWSADVADAPAEAADMPRNRHELLTLAGENIVYGTQAGTVIALNSMTGKPAWAFRYPRAKPIPQDFRYRGLAPPVAAAGRVFVAPLDGDAVYALDAETGRPLWKAGGLQTHSLLGVSGTKLVAALAGPVRGVRAFDVATGADAPRDGGWVNHDDPGLGPFGRGLVSAPAALWPTKGGLFPLAVADGFLAAPPVGQPQGNLAYADGVLIVATPVEVRGYVLDPTPQPAPATPPAVRVTGTGRPGWFPAAEDEPIPPPAPTTVTRTIAIPTVGTESLIPVSAAPPLAATRGGMIYSLAGDTPRPRGTVGFVPHFVKPMPGDDSVVLAGPDGVARVRTADPGGVDWTAAAPGYDLNHPAAAGTQIVCRAGEHHLVAFDVSNGTQVWVLDATGRNEYQPQPIPTAPRFDAGFHLDENLVLARTTAGRCLTVNARTGRVIREVPGPITEWRGPPAAVEPRVVAQPTGPGTVAGIDLRDGSDRWVFQPGRPASLAGELPQVRTMAGFLAVAVRRNLGTDLHRVHLRGSPGWGYRAAFIPGDGFDLGRTDADAEHLYCPVDRKLTALRLDDGREAWSVPLPAAHGSADWIARAAAGAVLVYPTVPIPEEPVGTIAARVGRSFAAWPAANRVAGLSRTLYEGWAARTVPVLVLDPDTGRERRRFDLPAEGPFVAVSFTPGAGMTVVTGTRVYTLK